MRIARSTCALVLFSIIDTDIDIAVSNHIDIDACDIETLDLTAHHPTGRQIRQAHVTLI